MDNARKRMPRPVSCSKRQMPQSLNTAKGRKAPPARKKYTRRGRAILFVSKEGEQKRQKQTSRRGDRTTPERQEENGGRVEATHTTESARPAVWRLYNGKQTAAPFRRRRPKSTNQLYKPNIQLTIYSTAKVMKSSKGAKAGKKKAGAAVFARAQAAPPARYGSPRRLVCSSPPRVCFAFFVAPRK